LDTVIRRAEENGVESILVAGIDLQSSIDAVNIAKRFAPVYACVGVHPWNADKFDQTIRQTLGELTREKKVIAISEIGLDFVSRRDPSRRRPPRRDTSPGEPPPMLGGKPLPREVQANTFRSQVRLAKEVKLPILFHCNAARAEILGTLREGWAADVGGAVHGFNGDLGFAEELLDLGFYISIGRAITRPDNTTIQDVVKGIPIEKLLIETDGGDPMDVKTVAEKVAELKGISVEEVGHTTSSNLRQICSI
jgi:TatD DNase family protein